MSMTIRHSSYMEVRSLWRLSQLFLGGGQYNEQERSVSLHVLLVDLLTVSNCTLWEAGCWDKKAFQPNSVGLF